MATDGMENDAKARLKQWLSSGQARLQPLTFPQRELWENSPIAPGAPGNHICSFFEINGPVTLELCETAVSKVVQRQEAMRTSFLPGKDRPLQIIRSTGETVIRHLKLSRDESRPEALQEIMTQDFRKPFDFLRGPLYRMSLLERGEHDFLFAFTIHHAVADGWTLGAFVEDLCTAYILALQASGKTVGSVSGIRDALPPLQMTHTEWGAAERARWTPAEIERFAGYWRERLQGSRQLWDAAPTGQGEADSLQQWVTTIPEKLADRIRLLARKSGATLFSTLLTAFQLTLHRWTGIDDITVGSPVANRNRSTVRETMGYFAGVIPLRGIIDPDQTFLERVRSVHEKTMDDFAHAMPFAELVKALDRSPEPGGHAIFDTRFAFQNHPIPEVVLPGISTKLRTSSTGTARFDIGCELTEDGKEFEVVWLHRPSVLSELMICELDGLFQKMLGAMCDHPDTPCTSLSL